MLLSLIIDKSVMDYHNGRRRHNVTRTGRAGGVSLEPPRRSAQPTTTSPTAAGPRTIATSPTAAGACAIAHAIAANGIGYVPTHKTLALTGSVGFDHHSVTHGGRPSCHCLRHCGSTAMRLLRHRLKIMFVCNSCSCSQRGQDSHN